jgi:steroid 5-alpha reductase family enzyme
MSPVSWSALLTNLVVTLVVTLVLITATFGIAVRRRRYDTVDTFWGLGFAAVAVLSFSLSAGHGEIVTRALVSGLTVIWGVRLGTHIQLRNNASGEDARYAALLEKGGPGRMFVRVYLLQAVLLWLISTPVQAAQYGTGSAAGPGVIGWIGVAVWLVGMIFETGGDLQLTRFKGDPANKGKVLDTGLWRYTRHPNYFGDACVWWGLYLLACHSWPGVATVFAPLIMTALLAKGTGKPMLERSMIRRRPAYADYVQRTSGFFPLPPKKVRAGDGAAG